MKSMLTGAAIGALLAMPFAAQAQQTPRAPDPADPHAAVPALEYRSAFAGAARPPAEAPATPDQLWRQANDTVAASAGHGGHAGGHEHAQAAAPAQPAKPAPAAPAAAPAHGKHH